MSNERTGVLELTLGDTYIGSAYSPQVEVTDTDTGHEVAITYTSPEGIVTERFDVEDGVSPVVIEVSNADMVIHCDTDGRVNPYTYSNDVYFTAWRGTERIPCTVERWSFSGNFNVSITRQGTDGNFGILHLWVPAGEKPFDQLQPWGYISLTITAGGKQVIRNVYWTAANEGPQGPAGYSPTVAITDTPTGHTVTITDAQGQHSYDVPNYAQEEQERQDAWDELSDEVTDAISDAETATSAASTAAQSATGAASSATSAAQAANTAAASANTAASSANAAATAANAAASDASAAATSANAAASAASSAADDASDAADEARQIAEDIQEELDAKADTHGQYPSLSVGRADALTGADESAQWATRVTAGSGAATVRSVHGATVTWNQLAEVAARTITQNGITFVIGEDGTITANGTATAAAYIQVAQPQVMADHKYLVKGCPAGGSGSTYRAYLTANSSIVSPSEQQYDFGAGYIQHTIGAGSANFIVAYISSGQTVTNLVFRPQLFDLTQMFGAGNEPATVAEFERMFPEPYYPYSAPTLKPVTIAGIASTDAQGGELDGVEWPTQTLRAAGSVRDELTADELVTRVGVVDLGTLPWLISTPNREPAFYCYLSDAAGSQNTVIGVACAGLTPVTADTLYLDTTTKNIVSINVSAALQVRHNAATPAEFKAAVNGMLLFYELATPTTTPISPALDMTYRVEQGGSESIIVPEGEISAAPVLTVADGESAAELVMDALACIAAPDGPVATANHAINTYLTMHGKLYKVTSAIAVGETIAAGTNVTQTTVMAELIARTA